MTDANAQPASVFLVEDDEATRRLLAGVIEGHPLLELAGEADSCAAALPQLEERPPDVLLTDLGLPDGSGIALIRALRGWRQDALAMVITVIGDEQTVLAAIAAGASGYLLKGGPGPRVAEAVLELLAGGSPMTPTIARSVLRLVRDTTGDDPSKADAPKLTEREHEVLRLIAKGFKFGEIASMLSISEYTVKTHVRHIYRKLEVDSRGSAVYEALQWGLVKAGD